MSHIDGTDVLDVLEQELGAARAEVARTVERLDALTDLRAVAQELTGKLGPLADMHALITAPCDAITRARLTTLVARLANTIKETP